MKPGLVLCVLTACGVPDQTAILVIDGLNGQTVVGSGGAELDDGVVSLDVSFTEAPPGDHLLALQAGLCAETSLGTLVEDLEVVTITSNGTGGLALSRPGWTLGDGTPATDLAQMIVVFYETADGGDAWGCGDLTLEDGDEK